MIIITVGCCLGSSGDCRAPSQLWSLPVLVHVEGGRKDDDHADAFFVSMLSPSFMLIQRLLDRLDHLDLCDHFDR